MGVLCALEDPPPIIVVCILLSAPNRVACTQNDKSIGVLFSSEIIILMNTPPFSLNTCSHWKDETIIVLPMRPGNIKNPIIQCLNLVITIDYPMYKPQCDTMLKR